MKKSGRSGPADSLKPKPDQKCSRTTPSVCRTTPGVRRTTPRVHRKTPARGCRTTPKFLTTPGLAGQPRGLAGQPNFLPDNSWGGVLCGPYKSLHAHVLLNSAVLIGVASMKPLSGRVCRFAQACSRGSPDNPRGSPDNPKGSPDNPRGSPDNPRVRRTTPMPDSSRGWPDNPREPLVWAVEKLPCTLRSPVAVAVSRLCHACYECRQHYPAHAHNQKCSRKTCKRHSSAIAMFAWASHAASTIRNQKSNGKAGEEAREM